ncbi:MerR family transcriptional regulator [candidate division KSB1 bacterium]
MKSKADTENHLYKEPIFPIGVAAKMVGVSPSTLRMYESESLLIPYKTSTNMRLFSQQDLEWIQYIRSLIKKEKLSVEGIRRILALIPCFKIRSCDISLKDKCEAYTSNGKPCWALQEVYGECQNFECRTCVVYRDAVQAFDTKKMLGEYMNF